MFQVRDYKVIKCKNKAKKRDSKGTEEIEKAGFGGGPICRLVSESRWKPWLVREEMQY